MSKEPLRQLSFVVRTGTATQYARSTQRVAKIPAALFDWASIAAQMFWQDHGRCIVFLLFYDPLTATWGIELPRQECTAEGCRWSIAREDLPQLGEGCFLAGSLQTFGGQSAEPEDLVPPFAGIHFLVRSGVEGFFAYVREGSGTCAKVNIECLILDDRAVCIEDAENRLELV